MRRSVEPGDLVDAPPLYANDGTLLAGRGHRARHGLNDVRDAQTLNSPDRIFSGTSINGRVADIYYRDGHVVITNAGKKHQVVTQYRPNPNVGANRWADPSNWNPHPDRRFDEVFVEVQLDGGGTIEHLRPQDLFPSSADRRQSLFPFEHNVGRANERGR